MLFTKAEGTSIIQICYILTITQRNILVSLYDLISFTQRRKAAKKTGDLRAWRICERFRICSLLSALINSMGIVRGVATG